MAHFAKLDENNTVIEVVSVNNDVLDADNEEESGIAFLHNLYGVEENWKQTSYNSSFRKQYAGVGFIYDAVADVFIRPKLFESWSLDENYDWQPPTPKPQDGFWLWNENDLEWVEIPVSE